MKCYPLTNKQTFNNGHNIVISNPAKLLLLPAVEGKTFQNDLKNYKKLK